MSNSLFNINNIDRSKINITEFDNIFEVYEFTGTAMILLNSDIVSFEEKWSVLAECIQSVFQKFSDRNIAGVNMRIVVKSDEAERWVKENRKIILKKYASDNNN